MPKRILLPLAMAVPASLATAQFTAVIPYLPSPMATTEGNTSNAFPWGRGGAGLLIQNLYDSSHFTSQGITYPIVITGLQWRLNGNATSLASTQTTGSTVALSTSPLDAMTPSTTFASNRGGDYTVCWSGVQSWAAAAATPGPTPFSISTPFSTNFVYDPNLGDLNIETDIPIQTFTGTAVQLDVQSTGSLASRVYLSTGYVNGGPNATGTINASHGVVVEITYVPANGLYPSFSGTPRTGPIGQQVAFTDHTFTSDPGGVTSWAWDVNGDNITDYTTQNCQHTYGAEGTYNVSLTVTSAMFGVQTITKNAYVTIDAVDASYTWAQVPGVPTLVLFTDTSTGNPTAWAWDFENDGITDSAAQNPAFNYPGPGLYTCKLTVTDAISNDQTTQSIELNIIPLPGFGSTFSGTAATRGYWFQAPTRFSIVSAKVPDEFNDGTQNVAIYRLAGAPPTYSGTATGGLEFFASGQPSVNNLPCVVSFDAGEYVGVLGACGTTTMRNSYGTPAGAIASSVLGQPTTLTRFGTQFNLFTNGPTYNYPYWQEPAGAISRVALGVTACAGIAYGAGTPSGAGPAAPTLKCTALPYVGQTAVLEVTQNDTGVLSFMVAGFGRAATPTPYGTVLVNTILATAVMNGAAIVGPGSYTQSFAVPNDPGLVGVAINWQNANFVVSTGQLSFSNGNEFWIDL
jgi:PKD repeat protein